MAAEAALLLLLLRRRKDAIDSQDTLDSKAVALEIAIRQAVLDGRITSAAYGTAAAQAELSALGLQLEVSRIGAIDEASGVFGRVSSTSRRFADRWLELATDIDADFATRETTKRLGVISATDSSEAYNTAKTRGLAGANVELYKVWDATLDKRTCPVCESAHGDIVRLADSFPAGIPGAVHGNCRCSFTILQPDEVNFSFDFLAA